MTTDMDGRDSRGIETDRRRGSGFSRRDVLTAAGASVALGPFAVGRAAASTAMTDFVETDGTEFVLGGEPVYFNGTNNFWITDAFADRARVDALFELFDAMGIDLLRTWAHCEGGGGHCLQPELGVYSEEGLQHLDYVIARAKAHGIRLVLAFADNWDHDGGIPKYLEWIDGAEEHADFYTMEACRDAYRNHVETIVTRENTITGLEYRDEPAIAIWELANEPRLERGDAEGVDDHHAVYHDWLADMSAYVKELDQNHLVSTGAEGFYTRAEGENWMYDDGTGQDFVENHSIETIDACSFHMYPYHWPGLGLEGHFGEEDVYTAREWIVEHVTDAHDDVGKPVYCGEFNVNVQEHDLVTRNKFLEIWYDAFDEYDCNAVLPWQIVLEETDDHDGFQLYRSQSGDIIEAYGERAAAKTGGGGPVADATSPATLRVGESGAFSGAYSSGGGNSIDTYAWDFGDGASATGERVHHRFDAPGEYEVSLSVTDGAGSRATDAEVVTVEDVPEGSMLVEGSGRQVADDVNEFHVAYTTISGDFAVEARVSTMASTDPYAQAGIVALEDLAAEGALGGVAVTPNQGTELVRAYDESTPTWQQRTRDDRAPPLWLRLERSEGYVTGYASADGETWTQLDDGQADLGEDAHVGLFVSSNAPGELCAVQFDEVDWLVEWEHADVGDVAVPGHATAGGEAGPSRPSAPTGFEVTTSEATAITVGWSPSSDAVDAYEVLLDGSVESTLDADATEATLDGLEPETAYAVGVRAVAGGARSPATSLEVTTAADGDGPPGFGEYQPRPYGDDGLYWDVDGTGTLGSNDVVVFFEHFEEPAIQGYPSYYDFNGSGGVGFDDVVALFQGI